MAFLHATIAMLVLVTVHAQDIDPLSDEFINQINSKQSTWTAGRNFPSNTPMSYIKTLLGALPDENRKAINVATYNADDIADLPESFDVRDKWPNCPSLNEIRDQGACASCWALSSAAAMTDRVCTYSNGTQNFHFSAEDIMGCAPCGGCQGGSPDCSWFYWNVAGIVSGGNYNTSQGCKPYGIPTCDHHIDNSKNKCTGVAKNPECVEKCAPSYNVDYKKDKRYGKVIYTVEGKEDNLKAELFKNGSLQTALYVYSDFLHYKTGVYRHSKGKLLAGHAVKMLGWGIENGTKYWLIANSWNTNWGDNGFFKILRGENHCGIESDVITGEPLLVDD